MPTMKQALSAFVAAVGVAAAGALLVGLLSGALSDNVSAPQAVEVSFTRLRTDPTVCVGTVRFGLDFLDKNEAAALGFTSTPAQGERVLEGPCAQLGALLNGAAWCKRSENLPVGWPPIALGNRPDCMQADGGAP